MLINHLESLPKTKRDLDERLNDKDESKIKLAKKYGKEYFDGTRDICYGGYYYDGRWKPVAKQLIDYYKLLSRCRVLDVGCAKGFLLHDIQDKNPSIDVYGLDVSNYALNHSVLDVRNRLLQGNAIDLPYKDNFFDLVISINTIHNLKEEECRKAVREIQRVGKQGYIVVDAYTDEKSKERIMKWNVTAETILSDDDWVKLFKEEGYKGDYFWFIP